MHSGTLLCYIVNVTLSVIVMKLLTRNTLSKVCACVCEFVFVFVSVKIQTVGEGNVCVFVFVNVKTQTVGEVYLCFYVFVFVHFCMHATSTSQARAFSVVGPSVWNGLLWRNDCSPGFFLTHFTLASKLFLFNRARVGSAYE